MLFLFLQQKRPSKDGLILLAEKEKSASPLSLRWTRPSLLARHMTSAPKEPNQNSFYATEKGHQKRCPLSWRRKRDWVLLFARQKRNSQAYALQKTSVTAKTVGVHCFLTLFQIPLIKLISTKKSNLNPV